MSDKSKPLRIGALIRVSTDRQERKGESLTLQKSDIERNAPAIGGEVAEWYGGSEHATPGWEKAEVDRMLQDAAAGKIDAVMVAYADRWSRDNGAGERGIRTFQKYGVRFFVGTREHDLSEPADVFQLQMSTVMGQLQAATTRKKSIEARIHRARRGLPTCGKLPFGRTFDRSAGGPEGWAVDPDAKAMMEDVARRYLAGESLRDLATEYGFSRPILHKNLMHRSGGVWEQTFADRDAGTTLTVPTPVPPLLDDATIEAVTRRCAANRTTSVARRPDRYLLTGMVFCGKCGYALSGQLSGGNARHHYYRHGTRRGAKECDVRPRPFVRCDDLEDAVMRTLFDLFGNPARVVRAIEEARPDPAGAERLHAQAERLRGRLNEAKAGRGQLLRMIGKGKLTDEQAGDQLDEIAATELRIQSKLAALERQLRDIPAPGDILATATAACGAVNAHIAASKQRRAERIERAKRRMEDQCADTDFAALTHADRRTLAEMVFVGTTPDGKPAGVYVEPVPDQPNHRSKTWSFRLSGLLLNAKGRTGTTVWDENGPDAGPAGGPMQSDLLQAAARECVSCTSSSPPVSARPVAAGNSRRLAPVGWKRWGSEPKCWTSARLRCRCATGRGRMVTRTSCGPPNWAPRRRRCSSPLPSTTST
ncbi:hypothetical protein LzC2_22240 [Planctomycetes bacterium LzC2]|uniref:Resolvase/invertase-type recombinase catalytic domain-containing protein n=1 Tax=Alienimonas chondri TaxID=2681879 RepID=A0ABX1VDL4_9PLAN|nr:hypothetical protein [Alienimonas chondri]